MNADTQEYLDLVEETGKLAFFDIEASGLKADYNNILVASVKPFRAKPITFKVDTIGNDRTLVKDLRDCLEDFSVICGYYSKGFDIPMIRSRLLKYKMIDLDTPHHLDMYYILKYHTLAARKSQAHLIEWLGTENKKMTLSPDVWSQVAVNPGKHLPTLVRRCESDCAGLEGLYVRTRHLIKDLKR